jgi:hypothetical protein
MYCAARFSKTYCLHGAAEMARQSGGIIKMRLGSAKMMYFFRPLERQLGGHHPFRR